MTERSQKLDEAKRDAGWLERLDLDIVKVTEPYGDHPAIEAIGTASELADQPPLITASLVACGIGLAAKDRRLARTGARMLASHALATGMKTLIKNNFDRPRPDKVEREGEHQVEEGTSEDGEKRSLPSGHSAGAFAVARAVARDYPGASIPAHTLAGTAALVQVPRKAHFLSDVVIGTAIGFAAEAIVSGIFRKLEHERDEDRSPPC
ncbi:phosphatase PAP2 family protein [Sphingomicrobium sp. XHP0239]|uniref:phosphatase PAP2 family protein n=1 Tax=Sphingomicrobium maritimum TaxID=3133972 RepID=UPI0031CCC78D